MQRRRLCAIVENHIKKDDLENELRMLSSLMSRHKCAHENTDNMAQSVRDLVALSTNLHNIENCVDALLRSRSEMARTNSLLQQLNCALEELMPCTFQFQPCITLAIVSSAMKFALPNMFKLFFFHLHASYDDNSTLSQSKRNRILKTSEGEGQATANQIFKALCSRLPQTHRLPVILFALQDRLGGKNGLKLLVNIPLPNSNLEISERLAQPNLTATASATGVAAAGSQSKLNANFKKIGKSQQPNVGAAVSVTLTLDNGANDLSSKQIPVWMPATAFNLLSKVTFL